MPTSVLQTDGYKFSMAEAGFPLREETFYYAHRRGGWQYLPLDVEAFIRRNLPVATESDYAFLAKHGYAMGGAFRQAITLHDQIKITSLPKGSWFYDREPVFSVTGPSALVSWLEPLVLQLNLRIQVATQAFLAPATLAEKIRNVTCDEERNIILETLADIRYMGAVDIKVDHDTYVEAVTKRALQLIALVDDPDRLFEVGMRAVSCEGQHRLALLALREVGIKRTSNVALAERYGMIPVGTMGHEHVQRHGSDYAAYCAMRDRHPGFVFYLPDTFDTMLSGVPSALAVMGEDPNRNSGIRFDSEHGIVGHYLYAVNRAREAGLTPVLGLESGWDAVKTAQFEALRAQVRWPANRQCYGYGGYLVKPPWAHFSRDTPAAVWKITRSGTMDTMKFGDEPGGGKSSIPGRPVVWRPMLGSANHDGSIGIVAQEGEVIRDAYLLSGAKSCPGPTSFRVSDIQEFRARYADRGIAMSPATRDLIASCTARKAATLATIRS